MFLESPSKVAVTLALFCYSALGQYGSAVRGEIVDQFGTPIADAVVAVGRAGDIEQETRSDSSGQFRISQLSPGPKYVFVTAGGFRAESIDVVLRPSRELYVDIGLTVASVTDSQKRLVNLRVLDQKGKPAARALVYLRSLWNPRLVRHLAADKAGHAKFTMDEIGGYEIHVRGRDGASGTVVFAIGPGPESLDLEVSLRTFDLAK
jgi:hypothetical protein